MISLSLDVDNGDSFPWWGWDRFSGVKRKLETLYPCLMQGSVAENKGGAIRQPTTASGRSKGRVKAYWIGVLLPTSFNNSR